MTRFTRFARSTALPVSLLALALAGGCAAASEDASFGGDGGGAGVAQGGAQDFGQFRAILDDGDLPGPETLDDVGFFNEHKLELPPADCGQDICLHGELGVMGNMINGSNCTLLMLGMNTPIDPSTLQRPPLNLAIAVDTSGSMAGDPIGYVREGLYRMLDDLGPDDRVSLVAFDDQAEVVIESVIGNDPELTLAIGSLQAGGSTNIYDGLRVAYETVEAHADPALQNRVILLSDGEATSGIQSDTRLVEMSAAYNAEGYGLTTIGVGDGFNPELMRDLAEKGAGAFYFLEDPAAVLEVFEEEVKTFLVPLAKDVEISVQVDPGYALRAIYGTKQAQTWGNVGQISIPSLQIAHRTAVDDNEGGRRGGGGAMIVEVVPRDPAAAEEEGTVGQITMSWDAPGSDETMSTSVKIRSPLSPGQTPDEGHFSFAGVEKSFVMLNIYAGFQMAATRSSYGDLAGARGVLVPLAEQVEDWLADNPDADIEDDLKYIRKFIDNLDTRGAADEPQSPNPPNPWPQD
ncbi:vWA domain-containing protein [Paraliomyxa miuraensis]|uniref:vWA domain-containing protein n=1 Tax=Paraliomyxa miuraensis TaxID=376150 RepID=UPI00225975A0|nr:VWA domain-containing protein [Paraliomyxa miuraensis]MCX4247903.1 VWA domain-containing protein [Paraliomyxa miuraensis]